MEVIPPWICWITGGGVFQGSGRAAGGILEGRRADLSETGRRGWKMGELGPVV